MTVSSERQIIYPDSDGQPMADNTKQFRWIVLLKENLECLFAQNPDVFVAGDLLWYPVEGNPEIRVAPDVFVVFGRQKGDRGSYRQWLEDNIAPQVVFEILSPGNTLKEMLKKQQFYDRYGVEEYYIYNPENNELTGLQRLEDSLTVIEEIKNWTSPRLGIRFVVTPETLEVYYPDGTPFLTTIELKQRADSAESELAFIKQFLEQQGIEIPTMDGKSY
ncbi:Uma2 family endonuclease [Cyanobacterium aponinum FACHB-4101]|uniref:Uma2 family endonuclease n=1 Tax=Cyanobacterium aponinum TaxID=379064 RepID=UPI0016804C53|nr:Uma2 family endonuclease [Cyanobacterium aponinum]MBD2394956.1 Uma2 family endonuclease [Cyanobacterium aponinum FACHB-4101]